MRCYYHPEKDAIGLCSSCHRGLCASCVKAIGRSLACPGLCEQDVEADEASVPTADRLKSNERSNQSLPLIFGILGLIILSWTLPSVIILHDYDLTKLVLWGVICLIVTGLMCVQRRAKRSSSNEKARRV